MAILSLLKKPKKRRKKSRRAYLIAAIDAIVSKQVRGRDGNRCRKCGRAPVAGHHIFGKAAHPATRWVKENLVSICWGCHRDAHASHEDFRRWVLSWMGEAEYEALYTKAQMRVQWKDWELEMLLKEMRKAA